MLSAELWSLQGLALARKAYRSFGRRGLLAFAGSSLISARDWLEATFESERAHGLLAPWVLHTGLGPEQAVAGFMTQVIACALQLGGMPVPKGGGVRLVEALAGIVREPAGSAYGRRRRSRAHLGRAGERRASERRRDDHGRAGRDRERHTDAALRPAGAQGGGPGGLGVGEGFRYGRAGMQIHLALDALPQWTSPEPSGSRAPRWCTSRPA